MDTDAVGISHNGEVHGDVSASVVTINDGTRGRSVGVSAKFVGASVPRLSAAMQSVRSRPDVRTSSAKPLNALGMPLPVIGQIWCGACAIPPNPGRTAGHSMTP